MDGHMKHILRLHLFFWLSLLGLTLSPFTFAASYKWTDSKGNVHYSQHPPQNKSYEKIKTPKHRRSSAPTSKPASTGAGSSTIPSEKNTKGGEDVLKNEIASHAETRKKNCEKAKQNLEAYSVYRRIRDPDGTIRVIPDKERAEQLKQAKDGVKQFCD